MKAPVSHRARGETPTTGLALGENREGKERVKSKASRIQSSRIGPTLVCVRQNVQHRELNPPESTRFVLVTVVMVDVSTSGPIGCLVSPSLLTSHETSPASHRASGETPTISLALGTNREDMERVKRKASRIQSSRKGSALLVCVRRNAKHRELNFPGSMRFLFIAVVMVAVSSNGPIGCLVIPAPLSFQNISSRRKAPAGHGDRSNTAH